MGRLLKIIKEIKYFFPIQIMLTHFKKNQVLLFFWLIPYAILVNNWGLNVGLPFLLLDPEYMHDVTFRSMLIMGISFGIFTISFFMTSYILDSHKFPFLATVKYPFIMFSLNNSILPGVFISIYMVKYYVFQVENGFESRGEIIIELLGFMIGFIGTLLILFFYFSKTNRKGIKRFAQSIDFQFRRKKINAIRVVKRLNDAKNNRFVIRSYITLPFKIKRVNNNVMIFDKEEIVKIIDQHHLNAITVELLLFISILGLGLFKDNPIFQIPAAASGLLLFSFFTMFTGAFSYWFRGWAITGIILLFMSLNYLIKNELITSQYQAFGLNYTTEQAEYTLESVAAHNNDIQFESDKQHTIQILDNWKSKFPANSKPKMVFVCASGGGQRAALWTTHTLQYVDSMLHGNLMKHTQLMTGASGGLIGAGYYRELCLRKSFGEIPSTFDPAYSDNIGKDILNPMIFSLVVSDFFLRFKKFEYEGKEYYNGRGYAFEQTLNKNIGGILDRKVMDYKPYEKSAHIPMMIMSPTITNDGRRLYISPHPVSYMNRSNALIDTIVKNRDKGIDFMQLFKNQDAEDLRFLSALRMSATFPYITPNVELPSKPRIEVMDAGLHDNFGINDAVQFILTFKEWITKNTGGVVIVSIRDSENNPEIEPTNDQSIWGKMFNPIGSLYKNWGYIQDFTNESKLEQLANDLGGLFNFVSFQYIPRPQTWEKLKEKHIDYHKMEADLEKRRASLSWHLTNRERESIKRTIYEDNNQQALKKLTKLLEIIE